MHRYEIEYLDVDTIQGLHFECDVYRRLSKCQWQNKHFLKMFSLESFKNFDDFHKSCEMPTGVRELLKYNLNRTIYPTNDIPDQHEEIVQSMFPRLKINVLCLENAEHTMNLKTFLGNAFINSQIKRRAIFKVLSTVCALFTQLDTIHADLHFENVLIQTESIGPKTTYKPIIFDFDRSNSKTHSNVNTNFTQEYWEHMLQGWLGDDLERYQKEFRRMQRFICPTDGHIDLLYVAYVVVRHAKDLDIQADLSVLLQNMLDISKPTAVKLQRLCCKHAPIYNTVVRGLCLIQQAHGSVETHPALYRHQSKWNQVRQILLRLD